MKSKRWLDGNCKGSVGYLLGIAGKAKQLQQHNRQTEKDQSSTECKIKCNISLEVFHTRKSILVSSVSISQLRIPGSIFTSCTGHPTLCLWVLPKICVVEGPEQKNAQSRQAKDRKV